MMIWNSPGRRLSTCTGVELGSNHYRAVCKAASVVWEAWYPVLRSFSGQWLAVPSSALGTSPNIGGV